MQEWRQCIECRSVGADDAKLSIHTDVLASRTVDSLAGGRFSMQTTAMAFIRDALAPYLQATMTQCVADVVHAGVNLDLCTDPLEVSWQRDLRL